jgi:hypothetical protein
LVHRNQRPSRRGAAVLMIAVLISQAGFTSTGGGDCNGNGQSDDLEWQTVLSESFEAGLPQAWSASGLWHVTDQCAPTTTCDGTSFAYFGVDGVCNFETGSTIAGDLVSPPIDIPASATSAELVFCSTYDAEGGAYDLALVWVNGVPVDVVSDDGIQLEWVTRTVDLSAFIGQQVTLRFEFDSVDFIFNFNRGWQVDRVHVRARGIDCNGNGTPDLCDVFTGSSADCNGDGVPDECEEDCNANGFPDDCDVVSGTSLDCDGNGVPDECDPDCNANGVPDICDLAASTSFDCNLNGVPDECDTALGASADCNSNSIPDECEVAGLLLEESFEAGLPADWFASGLWHVTDQCSPPSTCDGTSHAYFGQNGTCTFATGSAEAGVLVAPPVSLPGSLLSAQLEFCSAHQGESYLDVFDLAIVTVNGIPVDIVSDDPAQLDWEVRSIDLTSYIGQSVVIQFEFDSRDQFENDFLGWQIDRVRVTATSALDCNQNDVTDECDISSGTSQDCNANGLPDDCELAGNDCDANGVPDECDTDCNTNGTPDACEAIMDCNANGLPDECELSGNDCDANGVPDECDTDCNTNGIPDACEAITDCNANGLPDECELSGNDCDANGVPDECDADCNTNGTPDACEAITDCNANGLPDECELSGNDCDANGVPDECDADCNSNGTPDACEAITDCNANGLPDECELSGNDCDANGVPDECDADCNSNGTPDACEAITDCNANGLPDECELSGNDCDANGVPDECDADCNTNGTPDACEAITDCNTNGLPDECDIAQGSSPDLDGNGTPDECQLAIAFCFGDGSGAPCPCGNTGGPGKGCANSFGAGAQLSAGGSNSVSADDLTFLCTGLIPHKSSMLFSGTLQENGGLGLTLGDGLRCAGGSLSRIQVTLPDSFGVASWGPGYAAGEGWSSGDTRFFQIWYRDTVGGPCLSGFSVSSGLAVTFAP